MSVPNICGVILISADPRSLADFYAHVVGLEFEEEDHGGLDVHYGVDLGSTHFGIHPPSNFAGRTGGGSCVAFAVADLDAAIGRLQDRGAAEVLAVHDEGFGRTTTYADPDGNLVELVELAYEFEG